MTWIQDYANVVGNRYASVSELPADNWYASNLVLKVVYTPADWPTGVPVQLFVHAWNEAGQSWEEEAIAFTQGRVTPRRMVNGSLFLLAPRGAAKPPAWDRENATLPRGKYLIKAYVDSQQRLVEDATVLLGEEGFYGAAEINRARWRAGFRQAESVFGKTFKKK